MRTIVAALVLVLPIGLIVLLRAEPAIDERWEDRTAHFWIVLAAGALNTVLAIAITENARRRRDARLLLIGLAFLVSAGFLGLHAIATPTVLVEGANAGFVLATPLGLVAAGAFAARVGGRVPARDLAADRAPLALADRGGARGDRGLGGDLERRPAAAARQRHARAGRVAADDPRPRSACRSTATPRSRTSASGGGAGRGSRSPSRSRSRCWPRRWSSSIASLTTSWQLSWWEWHVLMSISSRRSPPPHGRSGTRSASARSTSTRRWRAGAT